MTVPLLVLNPALRRCCKLVSDVGSPDVKCPNPVVLEVVTYGDDGNARVLPFCHRHLHTASELIGRYNEMWLQKALGMNDPTSGEGGPL